jgi:hypothetical protein
VLSAGEEGDADGLGDGVVVELAEDGAGDGVGVAFTTSVGGGDTFRFTTGLDVATLGFGFGLIATFWLERREILTGFFRRLRQFLLCRGERHKQQQAVKTQRHSQHGSKQCL